MWRSCPRWAYVGSRGVRQAGRKSHSHQSPDEARAKGRVSPAGDARLPTIRLLRTALPLPLVLVHHRSLPGRRAWACAEEEERRLCVGQPRGG